MRLLQNIRLAFQRRALSRILEKQAGPRGKMHYDDARHVGILFDASSLKDRELVLQFAEKLRQSGKKVSLLGFFDHPVEYTDFVFPIFMETDFDWALHPKGEAISRFLNEAVDLLIHADTRPGMYAEYVTASCKAQLRVGAYTGHTECYELMVDISGNQDLRYYLKQVEFLLQKTNTRHEAA